MPRPCGRSSGLSLGARAVRVTRERKRIVLDTFQVRGTRESFNKPPRIDHRSRMQELFCFCVKDTDAAEPPRRPTSAKGSQMMLVIVYMQNGVDTPNKSGAASWP